MNAASAFRLPALRPDAPPAFTSARACRDWLAGQPLANAARAQTLLGHQIHLLNGYPLPAAERLKILELMRDPAAFAQDESARKFAGRPLPLAAAEQATLDANRSLWQGLQVGYLHCLAAALAGEADVLPHASLAAQRAISALRAELSDLCRAAIEPPAGMWQTLHLVYAAAEQLGVADKPVTDSLQTDYSASSTAAAYVQMLLLHRVGPFELTARQLAQTARWLQRWSAKVMILTAPPPAPKVPPLIVDLASDQVETLLPAVGGQLRWLDLSRLAGSVKKRITRLQQGESPVALKLGEDCSQPDCENLLRRLYLYWFKGGAPRQHPRRSGGAACRLVAGLEATYYTFSGKVFRQPVPGAELSKLQHDEIATFGRVATRHEENQASSFAADEWCISDQSAAGLRLVRPLAQAGARIGAGQLVAVQPAGAGGYLLGVTRWSRIARSGELLTGVAMLPGAPVCAALRGAGLTGTNEKYRPCLLLPAVAAVNEPESVVMPAGSFRAGRLMELFVDAARQIRLARLLERGTDFERATFDRP